MISRTDYKLERLPEHARYALNIITRNPKQLKINDITKRMIEKGIGFNLALEAIEELENKGLVRKTYFGRYYRIRYELTQLI